MDPADKPGTNKPKSGDPTEPISELEVEKTLEKLESITSKLVREVGTPSADTQVQTPAPAAVASAKAAPAGAPPQAAVAPDAAPLRPKAGGTAAAQGRDGAAPSGAAGPAAAPAASISPGPAGMSPAVASPQTESRDTAPQGPPVAPAAADRATAPVQVTQPQQASAQPPTKTAPPAPGPQTAAGQPPDPEVEQEISQAIHQLEAGKPPAPGTPAVPPAQKPPTPAAQPVPAGALARAGNTVDRILWPLVVVITVLDLPFRRMPGAVRQLLGYVAVGTALMAVALWYYIFMLRGR